MNELFWVCVVVWCLLCFGVCCGGILLVGVGWEVGCVY